MQDTKAFWLSVNGFFAVSIMGTLFHFLYEISGGCALAGMFAPINETPFEHLKLLFFPFALWGILEYFVYGRRTKGFFFSKALGVTVGMIFILCAFYLYSSILNRTILTVDILIFVVSVVIAFALSLPFMFLIRFKSELYDELGVGVLVLEALMFWLVTIISF